MTRHHLSETQAQGTFGLLFGRLIGRLSRPVCSLVALSVALSTVVVSTAVPGEAAYRRPRNARPPSTATSTSGGRTGGTVSQNGLNLTLLAPQQHVGQSARSHPTFTWFVPVDRTLPGEFQLYEVTEDGSFRRVLEAPYEFVSEQGFMSFTLPDEVEGLQTDTQYIWQVLLRYGERPSEIGKVRSQIEIVEAARLEPLSADIATEIDQLAEAGLWYDALALAAELPAAQANEKRDALLLELAEIEAAVQMNSDPVEQEQSPTEGAAPDELSDELSEGTDCSSHSQALRKIANWEAKKLFSFLSSL